VAIVTGAGGIRGIVKTNAVAFAETEADVAMFLASDVSRIITGQVIMADEGIMVVV
jgi:enoyl-[acyl-carrier-protein] reductase (NADH)